MKEKEKYRLSLYIPVHTIHKTETSKVELVECSLDGKKYIKKTYNSDKRTVFNILSGIKSEHIPEIHEFFFGEDTIVIEQFIEGKTLEQLISEKESFTKKHIKIITESLLNAIDILHKNKIVHRDIKPSNIIITPENKAVLIDYSISRTYSDKRDSDTELFGTVGYAAPEQFGFSQSDYRTDIYAFGVTMKEIINRQNAPKRLYDAVARCTEFDPSRRFQSIDELRKCINKPKYFGVIWGILGLTAIGTLIIWVNSYTDKDIIKTTETETSSQITEQTAATSQTTEQTEVSSQVTEQTDTSSQITEQTEAAELNDEYYKLYASELITMPYDENVIPCIKMWNDGVYEKIICVGDSVPEIRIKAEKQGSLCSVMINDELYEFENTYTPEVLSYSDSRKIAEIAFYDMNGDGILDIIPAICDGVVDEFNGEITVLKNYSEAWCIYSDSQGGYKQADGEMFSYNDSFSVYESLPNCIWSDFTSYYSLEKNAITLKYAE